MTSSLARILLSLHSFTSVEKCVFICMATLSAFLFRSYNFQCFFFQTFEKTRAMLIVVSTDGGAINFLAAAAYWSHVKAVSRVLVLALHHWKPEKML